MKHSYVIEDLESPAKRVVHDRSEFAAYATPLWAKEPVAGLPKNGELAAPAEIEVTRGIQVRMTPEWKRALDITLIAVLLPLWLPVMVLIALFIKCTSMGPIFFRQERIGQGGRTFLCFKFRSMKVSAETQSHESHLERLMRANVPMTKLDAAGDSRLIFGGGILRATGLDELPQIFNVLAGDMSLVGPRPCTRFEFSRYETWQKRRVEAPAGLTGYWQVNGKNRTTFRQMIEMDIFYAENMSPALDLWILFRTVPVLVAQVIEAQMRKFAVRRAAALEPHPPILNAVTGNMSFHR